MAFFVHYSNYQNCPLIILIFFNLLDHDRGILTLDHIGFEEMENSSMREIESSGHAARLQLAYAREIMEPIAV
jgi:hypothetical protein